MWSFEFVTSIHFQFGASVYIMGQNRTFEYKVIVVWIWYKLPFSIWSISIYYETLLDIRVKSYCRLKLLKACVLNFERFNIWRYPIGHPSNNYCHLNLLRNSVFNLEQFNILGDSIGHPSKKLLSFEFSTSFHFQFGGSQYILGLCRTFE